jgi:prophage regulatory protein
MTTEQIVQDDDRILRMPEVMKVVGLSRPQIYLLISRNEFPKQIKLTPGGKASGWLLSGIMSYLRSRVVESRKLAT